MVRPKIKLTYIENESKRKVSYKKRVRSIIKKTEELSTLCNVDACAVVYGPCDNVPVVWPSSESKARRILMTYKGKPENSESNRNLNHEEFLKQSITKLEEKCVRLERKNRETDMENIISDLFRGQPVAQVQFNDIADLSWMIKDKLRSVEHMIRNIESSSTNDNPSANPNVEAQVCASNQACDISSQ